MVFILPSSYLRTLTKAAEDTVAKHQPGRSYDFEFVIRPRKRELAVNIVSKAWHDKPKRFRYQIRPLTRV